MQKTIQQIVLIIVLLCFTAQAGSFLFQNKTALCIEMEKEDMEKKSGEEKDEKTEKEDSSDKIFYSTSLGLVQLTNRDLSCFDIIYTTLAAHYAPEIPPDVI
jgi:hypothetical protein